MKKRIISMLLAIFMVVGMMPTVGFAAMGDHLTAHTAQGAYVRGEEPSENLVSSVALDTVRLHLVLEAVDVSGNTVNTDFNSNIEQNYIDNREGFTGDFTVGETCVLSNFTLEDYQMQDDEITFTVTSGGISITRGNAYVKQENGTIYIVVPVNAIGGDYVDIDCSTINLSASPYYVEGAGWRAENESGTRIHELYMTEPYFFTFTNCEYMTTENFTYIFLKNGAILNGGVIPDGVWVHVNDGIIQGGTYDGPIDVIQVHVYEDGEICGGTFNSRVSNKGVISGGTFNGALSNAGTIINNGNIQLGENFVLEETSGGTVECSAHIWRDGVCRLCGFICGHSMVNGVCTICGAACDHSGGFSAEGAVITESCTLCSAVLGTATLVAGSKTYDGAAVTATVTKTGSLAETDFTVTGCCEGGCVKAGDHTASTALGDLTVSVDFAIEQKSLTLKLTDCTKTYDGTNILTTFNAEVVGFVFYDEGSYVEPDTLDYDDVYDDVDVVEENLTVTLPGSAAGAYTTAHVSGITLTGETAANYTIAAEIADVPLEGYHGDFEINKASITITSADQIVSEGTVLDQTAYTVNHLLDGHTVSGVALYTQEDDNAIYVNTASVVITNAKGEDVTANFDIYTYNSGIITRTHEGHYFDANGLCATGECDNYQPAVSGTMSDEYGNESECYLIYNAGQLYWFAQQVNEYGNNAIYGKLMADITVNADLTAENLRAWTPIGSSYPTYNGHFDGNGKTISGLYVKSEGSYVGLFGGTDYAYQIKNIHITDSYFEGDSNVGALIGYAGTYISGCSVSDSVTVVGNSSVGGIVGASAYGEMNNCWSAAAVTQDGEPGAGLVDNNYLTITNCYTTASKLVGYNHSEITNSYYLSDTETADGGKTAEQFESGEVAYLLQSGVMVYDDELGDYTTVGAPHIWGQTIGTEDYPVLGGSKVYRIANTGCLLYDECSYSNDENATYARAHSFPEGSNGFCVSCDAYQQPETDDEGTYLIANAGNLYWFAAMINGEYGADIQNRNANVRLTADIDLNPGYTFSFDPATGTAMVTQELQSDSSGSGFAKVKVLACIGTGVKGSPYSVAFGSTASVRGAIYANALDAKADAVDLSVLRTWKTIDYQMPSTDNVAGGTFDGDGHTISGMFCLDTNGWIGLMNNVGKATTIRDLHIANSLLCTTGRGAGSLFARGIPEGVTGCSSSAIVIGSSDVGGLVGSMGVMDSSNSPATENAGKAISGSSFTGTAIADYYVGGILGNANKGTVVTNCWSSSRIVATGSVMNGSWAGGILGYAGNGSVVNCYFRGSVTGVSSYVNPIISYGSKVYNNYYQGDSDDGSGGKTEAQFASGEVAYLLGQGCTENDVTYPGEIWGQTLDTDAYPNFTGETVYQIKNCKNETLYSNTNADLDHSYEDGACTVCGEPQSEPITYAGSTLKYEDRISVVNLFRLPGVAAKDAGVMVFTKAQYDAWDQASFVEANARAGLKLDAETGCYYTESNPILIDDLHLTACYVGYARLADGTYRFTEGVEYGPTVYAYNMLADEKTDEKTEKLCVALLNYIAAEQKYRRPSTAAEDLANAKLTDEQKAQNWTTAVFNKADAVDTEIKGKRDKDIFTATGRNLWFGYNVSQSAVYKIEDSIVRNAKKAVTIFWTEEQFNNLTGHPRDTGNFGGGTEVAMVQQTTGQWMSHSPALAAKDIADTTIYYMGYLEDQNGNKYYTTVMAYNIEQYIESKGKNTNAFAELCRRLYYYERAAADYFA